VAKHAWGRVKRKGGPTWLTRKGCNPGSVEGTGGGVQLREQRGEGKVIRKKVGRKKSSSTALNGGKNQKQLEGGKSVKKKKGTPKFKPPHRPKKRM